MRLSFLGLDHFIAQTPVVLRATVLEEDSLASSICQGIFFPATCKQPGSSVVVLFQIMVTPWQCPNPKFPPAGSSKQ